MPNPDLLAGSEATAVGRVLDVDYSGLTQTLQQRLAVTGDWLGVAFRFRRRGRLVRLPLQFHDVPRIRRPSCLAPPRHPAPAANHPFLAVCEGDDSLSVWGRRRPEQSPSVSRN
jgi:hypothetical protein